jgi:hypothetical protein
MDDKTINAVCDVMAGEFVKMQALVSLLERKGVLLPGEADRELLNMPLESIQEVYSRIRLTIERRTYGGPGL